MLEVLFSNSAAGGLLQAPTLNRVVCLDLSLSMGDITAPLSEVRADYLQSTIPLLHPDFSQVGRELLDSAREGVALALKAARNREPIRVWFSRHNPDEYCGLCHFLSQLPLDAEVHAVELPLGEDSCWGDVLSEEFFRYPSRRLTMSEFRAFRTLWQSLLRDNGPLRAVVNGRLHTVEADFYDTFLRRELAAQPEQFWEACLIGDVLGKYNLGIRDAILALRLEEFIRRGELIPVTHAAPDVPIYHRILCKNP